MNIIVILPQTFNKVENQIQDAYESLADEEDRKLFKDIC